MTKPPLKWVGGKTQLLKELLARVPNVYNRYFEPFVGGGALFFALRPNVAYLCDSNAELINLYNVLRFDAVSLIKELQSGRYENTAERFYEIRAWDRDGSVFSDTERAARTVYLNKTCFNGLYRVNSKGFFNAPYGKYLKPNICNTANLMAVAAALQGAIPIRNDFREVEHMVAEGDFVYFDPPYAPLTATSNFTGYTAGGFGPQAQTDLRDMALRMKKAGVHVLLSNSSAPLIEDLYGADFTLEPVQARRSINESGDKRGKVKEYLIR
jgi:DNA adenine methylase